VFIARAVLCLLVGMILAGCQSLKSPHAPESTTPTPPVESTPEATPSEWLEHEVDGVTLGIEKPRGWHAQETEDGILLVEYTPTMANGDDVPGVQVHIFVHAIDKFNLAGGGNLAWSVLEQIVKNRDYIGSARANEPSGFQWGSHEAAYYLSNNGDGNVTMLIAIAIPNMKKMVACNVTSPIHEAGRIRSLLPIVLDKLTVNGARMDVAALDGLPDPLVFPSDPPGKRP
jgi:hypothetical protein